MMAFGAVIGIDGRSLSSTGSGRTPKSRNAKWYRATSPTSARSSTWRSSTATFSIDGVLGAFAFTMAVPLIIIGNGIGALIVREITVRNVDSIRKYKYLKNGAMYSIFCLGIIMILDSFGVGIPSFVSPIITFGVVGYFLVMSLRAMPKGEPA